MKHIIDILKERGLIDNVTSNQELYEHLQKPRKVYCGFDPTADGLHLGSYLPLRVAKWFVECGHTVVVLLGGATASIGDPSGKSHERPLLSAECIQKNLEGIKADIINAIGVASDSSQVEFVNNFDWFSKITILDFLRDIGKHFRLGPMLSKEMVKSRLKTDEGLSYTEFSYQILQGFDFYYLQQNHQVSVQIGGQDQWGNIISGLEYIGKRQGSDAYGLTFPLLLGSDGKKFGKTAEGAIWLSDKKLSPYDFYQYLLRVSDADVFNMLQLLTDVSIDEVEALNESSKLPSYTPNTAQKLLASELTKAIHGDRGLEMAMKTTQLMKPGSVKAVDLNNLSTMKDLIPTYQLSENQLEASLIDIISDLQITKSRSEGRRLVRNKGIYLNEKVIEDESRKVTKEDILDGCVLISVGKKRKYLLMMEG